MKINPFELERYFAKYELSVPYLFSSSDCQPLTMQEILQLADDQTLELWNNLILGYTDTQGHPLLRQEISLMYSNIKQENLVLMAPEEAIFIAMNTLLNQGDHVIATFPGYQSLYEIANAIGCHVSFWKPERLNTWHFSLDTLESLITDKTRLIVINFPHNPTGAMLSKDDYTKLIAMAQSKNILVFSDEMYKFLEYDHNDRLPSACDLYDNAISLLGTSKSFALPGLRIGWLATKNPQFIQDFLAYKDYTTICCSAPSEILTLIALKARKTILSRNLDIIQNNLTLFDNFCTRYPDAFRLFKPQAGSICFPELLLPVNVAELAAILVKTKGIMLLPSTVYNYEYNNFRVGLGRTNFATILQIFEQFLLEQKLV